MDIISVERLKKAVLDAKFVLIRPSIPGINPSELNWIRISKAQANSLVEQIANMELTMPIVATTNGDVIRIGE